MSRRYVLDARHVPPGTPDGAARVNLGFLTACVAQLGPDESAVVLARPDAAATVRAHVDAPVWELDTPPASLAQLVSLGRVLAPLAPAAYFYPQYDLPLLPVSVPAVSLIHDVTPIVFDRYFGRPRPLRTAAAAAALAVTCARSRVVLAVSEHTARATAELVPAARDRIRVAHPGPSDLPAPVAAKPRAAARFVYLGNHRPHKRVPLLLRAFARVRRARPEAELLLLGRRDRRFPEVPALLDGPLGERVRLVEGLDDRAVASELAAATALVFPSTGEGFGLPVLEAYAVGTPAIVADAGSLPELVGDAGLIVPALDDEALADAMLRLAKDPRLWRTLASRTAAARARFSWQRAGHALLAALRDASA